MTGAKEESREFLIAVRIKAGAREFIKKTAEDAGLRSLPGLFLVSVERPRKAAGPGGGGGGTPKESSSPRAQNTPATVAPAETSSSVALVHSEEDKTKVDSEGVDVVDPAVDPLQADDVLWYAGTAASIAMIRKIPGLAPYATDQVDKLNANSQERRLIQAVVAKTGPLVGKSIRDIKFRSRYNAVVLAVHREGVRVHARIGDVVLHPGDVLLLDAGPDFHREAGHSGSGFALVSVLEDSAPPRLRLLVPVLVIAVAMIVFYTAGVTELIIAAIFAAGIMIACGALSEQEARDAIKWDVIVTIAAAFGMSKALQNSGVAGAVAEKLVRLAELSGTGRGGLLVAVYLATFVISNVVTNNAAAALMFPVAAEAAERQGGEPREHVLPRHARGVRVVHVAVRVPDQPDGLRPGRLRLQGLFALWRADAGGADGGQRRGDRAGRQVLVRELGRDGTGVRRDVRADDDDAGERAQRLCRFLPEAARKDDSRKRARTKTRTRVGGAALVALGSTDDAIHSFLSVYCALKRFVRSMVLIQRFFRCVGARRYPLSRRRNSPARLQPTFSLESLGGVDLRRLERPVRRPTSTDR